MSVAETLNILLFVTVCVVLMSGYQVAFALAGSALLYGVLGHFFGVFDLGFFALFPSRIYGIMTNETLIAVPLFVFMGVMLERSKVAEDLLETMGALFGSLRGGLGISVVVVGALLAASTGIVGATVVTMGLLSLPTMLRRGYSPEIASGTIAASGTLGQIIPPSIVLILLGDVLSSEYQNVQFQVENYVPLSVGDLFAGALIPGFVLVGLYILYLIVMAILRPASLPAIPEDERLTDAAQLLVRVAKVLLPPVILIVAVFRLNSYGARHGIRSISGWCNRSDVAGRVSVASAQTRETFVGSIYRCHSHWRRGLGDARPLCTYRIIRFASDASRNTCKRSGGNQRCVCSMRFDCLGRARRPVARLARRSSYLHRAPDNSNYINGVSDPHWCDPFLGGIQGAWR